MCLSAASAYSQDGQTLLDQRRNQREPLNRVTRSWTVFMSEDHRSDSWLSFGLAFVGGYCDAAGYVLARTFTGHITGTLVLAAISIAGHDWRTFLRHLLAIALFLTGVVSILVSNRFTRTPSQFALPIAMSVEIVLISAAYFAFASHLTARFGLFVGCMSFALGLQNGAFSQAGGIGVHTTYLTGTITSLLKTKTERHSSQTTAHDQLASDQKVSLFGRIWLAFVLGATVGAAMVFRFGAPAVIGAALLLVAMLIGQSASRGPTAERKAHREICAEDQARGYADEDHAQRKRRVMIRRKAAWRVREGFPKSTISSIAQTPDGCLWPGTE